MKTHPHTHTWETFQTVHNNNQQQKLFHFSFIMNKNIKTICLSLCVCNFLIYGNLLWSLLKQQQKKKKQKTKFVFIFGGNDTFM